MRLLNRYIFRELASHALLGLAVFTFVFFVPKLVQLMDLVVRHWTHLGSVLLLVACALPAVLTFSLPIAVLVGALIGLGRLGADSEIIALNSVGIGRRHLLIPVGLFALAGTLITLGNTLWLVPHSLDEMTRIEHRLMASESSLEIEPRVFQEEFQHLILYIQDASASGRRWRGVFLADTGLKGTSEVTLARSAELVPLPGTGTLQIHLEDGSTQTYETAEPSHYSVATFAASDLALRLSRTASETASAPVPARESISQLLATRGKDRLEAQVELERRLAFPAACLVFGLLAIGVGARPRQTSRAMGFVLTLALLAGYYLVFVIGVGKARQGVLAPWLGVWLANIACAGIGAGLMAGIDSVRCGRCFEWIAERMAELSRKRTAAAETSTEERVAPHRRLLRFPLLVDLYLLRSFVLYFALTLAGFVLLFEVFTFFELLNDISSHHIAFAVVANYFRYLAPLLLYELTPLAALIATLVTLAVMSKYNEVIAFKASGVSLYRLSVPLLIAGLAISCGLFAMDAHFLPFANRKQDALRNEIKGLPAQTFFQPRLRWIFGQGDKIYNYELYDADHQTFAGLNVFELDPKTFALRRRIFAKRAQWEPAIGGWVLERGWVRDFRDERVVNYRPFTVDSFPEMREGPDYFRRQVLQSYQMNWQQLGRYIAQLRQAGFDVASLSVQWQRKFAFPLLAAIIILISIPFPFLLGTRSAVGGLAAGVGIGIVYWATSALFEAMGAVGQLPPVVAGWAPDAIFLFAGLYFFLKMPT